MAIERYTGLASVLETIRWQGGITQASLTDQVGLGRSVVAERVAELEQIGLIHSPGRAPSTGGRTAKLLSLNAQAGYVIGVDIASNEMVVSAADLAGALLGTRHRELCEIGEGPERILSQVNAVIDDVIREQSGNNLLGIGVGLSGPVNFDTGTPVGVPVMPGWEDYPVREEFAARWPVPAWVDNRVNLLALAEIESNPRAAKAKHLLYFGAGAGVGAALITDGRLYRGSHGLAGSIGHVAVPEAGVVACRCGRTGCLEAVTSGWAIERDGLMLAETGRSPYLAQVLKDTGRVRAYDVTLAAEHEDASARELLDRTAALLGSSLATLVSFFAPHMLVVGGGIARAKDIVLKPIQQAVLERLPSTGAPDLLVELSAIDEQVGGVVGAAQLVLGELFSKDNLPGLLERLTQPLRQMGESNEGLSA
ncbi:ROK family transcriptional regulator [Paenarthrobacter sp. TA1.8]|uniref:ROK family transcriptional regulator n=1 Tax=Paenarthrobacter sp. TA1.8 TaxID=3400219 RepID=UPI003B43D05B